MGAIITLTTDFGLTDAYVAAMKGVILSINPEAMLIDICHNIKPQNIRQGAFVLSTADSFFPPGTVHLVVVDPGVGTERRAIILTTPSAQFVAPDNGVLSHVITRYLTSPEETSPRGQIKLPKALKAVAITRAQFWRSPVSPTFHGRDIFAPVAARLSLGTPATDFGKRVSSVAMLPLSYPQLNSENMLVGHILHIDSFGNLITNIRRADLPNNKSITVKVGQQAISGLGQTYAEGGGLIALIGSSDYLEIALRDGNASSRLNAGIGDEVRVKFIQE